MSNAFSLSVVIPTYNRARLLRNLLSSLEQVLVPDDTKWDIIVVDNNSTDDTPDVVPEFQRKAFRNLHYLLERNQGASFARNRGVSEARGEIVAFLDDDEIVDDQWLTALREGFDQFRCAGIGGKVIAKWTFPPPSWYTTTGPFRIVGPTAGHDLGDAYAEYSLHTLTPIGANLAVRKQYFRKYGYFRTNMGPVGTNYAPGEDTEFCLRLMKGGERLIYSPKAITYNLVHRERVTQAYCKRFHFHFGRVYAQLHEPRDGVHTYGGVPRHLFREYGETLLRWTRATLYRENRARLHHRLTLGRISGQIFQHLLNKSQRLFFRTSST